MSIPKSVPVWLQNDWCIKLAHISLAFFLLDIGKQATRSVPSRAILFADKNHRKMKPEDHWSCKRSPETWTKDVAECLKQYLCKWPCHWFRGDSPKMTLTSSIHMWCSSLHFHILEYKSLETSNLRIKSFQLFLLKCIRNQIDLALK